MRLIDADAIDRNTFIKAVGENGGFISFGDCLDMLKNQPTAYNVDAVVEELENQAEQYRKIGFRAERDGVSNIADKYYGKQRSLLDTIEIVKAGGVE